MTTKEMLRTFSPIILFSIVLPIIDIVTDIRLIIRLFSSFNSCICHEDIEKLNVSHTEWENCLFSQDLSTFCQLYPNVCKLEKHSKFATILLGEFIVHMFNSNQLWNFRNFSLVLVKLYCFIHNMVSDGEEQDLDILSAFTQCLSDLW